MKYLNLTKGLQGMHTESYKPLLRDVKKTYINEETYSVHRSENSILILIDISPKKMYG